LRLSNTAQKKKKKVIKSSKGKREKLSLYPLKFDEAVKNLLTIKPENIKKKIRHKIK
jgi:hypothetical protein